MIACFLFHFLRTTHNTTASRIVITPREMPIPSPTFAVLLSPDDSDSGLDVRLGVVVSLVDVIASVDLPILLIAPAVVAELIHVVSLVTVLCVPEDVIRLVPAVRVAPRGVIKELVTAIVLSGTDDPTRAEYSGKKSAILCVFTFVVQLHCGPSSQQ